MDNYTLWTKHSEHRVMMQDGEGDDDDNIAGLTYKKRESLKMNSWMMLKKWTRLEKM